MNDERNDAGGGMDPADDAALWGLLGRARGLEVGPYFSRRVLREVTLAGEKRGAGSWLARLRGAFRRPRAAVWSGAAVVGAFWLSVVLMTNTAGPAAAHRETARVPSATAAAIGEPVNVPAAGSRGSDPALAANDDVAPQDVEVIADLDNVIAREENRLWTEDAARF